MPSSEELQKALQVSLESINWNIVGIQCSDGKLIPLPPESRIVTVILQALVSPFIIAWGEKHGIRVEDLVEETRGYPDYALSGGPLGNKLIALDVKSARYSSGDRVSRMTLGTYDGYFLHPNEKKLSGGRRSYNDYDEHWVIAFIYKWDPNLAPCDMVKIVTRIVAHKWQLASKISGSGDTANIGGLGSLSALQNRCSDFQNEEDFERYWRLYAVAHPRRRTRAPE
jgi:hypothetical protein